MPSRPNNIQLSLPIRYIEKLSSLAQNGESIGQSAKRILIELLEEDLPVIGTGTHTLENIETRLYSLETEFGSIRESIDRLEHRDTSQEFKEAIAKLETEINIRLEDLEDFKTQLEIEDHDRTQTGTRYEDRLDNHETCLDDLADRIESVESCLYEKIQDSEKSESFSLRTLQEEEASETLTDAQLAQRLGVAKSTVTRWRSGKLTPNIENFWENWKVEGTRWLHL